MLWHPSLNQQINLVGALSFNASKSASKHLDDCKKYVLGMAIMSLVLAFMLLGNGLRDAFDVKN